MVRASFLRCFFFSGAQLHTLILRSVATFRARYANAVYGGIALVNTGLNEFAPVGAGLTMDIATSAGLTKEEMTPPEGSVKFKSEDFQGEILKPVFIQNSYTDNYLIWACVCFQM